MKNKKYLFFVGALFLTLSSCVKDQPTEEEESALITSGNGVYIINEGNFQFGNASVSYYDVDTKTLKEDIYKTANSIALGDVAQSMAVLNNKAYIVVNNSSKIEVVNAQTFVSVATIAGLPSPRRRAPGPPARSASCCRLLHPASSRSRRAGDRDPASAAG